MNTADIETEELGVEDLRRFILNTLTTSTGRLLHRELVQNAIEATIAPGETKRDIYYYVENGSATIINSGVGMDRQTLINATNLACNVAGKEIGSEGRKNRGEGAKLMGLPHNKRGMRYRSRSNGVIHEVTIHWDEKKGYHGRIMHEGKASKIVDAASISATENHFYNMISGDFTEVRLFGNVENQNTSHDPYNDGQGNVMSIPHEIFNRYYKFKDIGIPISLNFRGSDFGDSSRSFISFTTMGEIVDQYPEEFEFINERRVELTTGVAIEYFKTVNETRARSPWNMYGMAPNGGRICIRWRGEMYDVSSGSAWGGMAQSYGFFSLGGTISVIIELEDDWNNIVDGRFRQSLSYKGKEVRCTDFKNDVVTFRPQWLLDIIKKRQRMDDTKDVQERINKFAETLFSSIKKLDDGPLVAENVIPVTFGKTLFPDGGGNTLASNGSGGNSGGGSGGGNSSVGTSGSGSGTGVSPSSRDARISTGQKGKKTNYPLAPKLVWGNEIEFAYLKGHGASYSGKITNELVMNSDYPYLQKTIDAVMKTEFNGGALMSDDMINHVRKCTKDEISFKVAHLVTVALFNSQIENWDNDTLEGLLDMNHLSLTFQTINADIKNIGRTIREDKVFQHLKQSHDASTKSVATKKKK